MTYKYRFVSVLLAGTAIHTGAAIAQVSTQASPTSVERANSVQIAGPVVRIDRVTDRRPNDGPPEGVPPRLHAKVLQLYTRIHNAYPDASRKRIFLKIAEVLKVNPRRLWNLYHHTDAPNDGPFIIDARPIDVATDRIITDRVIDRVADRPTRDRATDRPQRDRVRDRVRDRPVIRDRARRDRPVPPSRRGG